MKIAVTGAYGQLGGELCRQLGADAIPLDIDTLDLTDGQAVFDRMLAMGPDAIVNCAAYTQVDKAESEPQRCRAVNATAVEHLARACGALDCPLVQISTDYVFGAACPKPRPWRENDPPLPQGVYARTKLEGEQAAAHHPKHLIVRTCGLYARPSDPRAANFVRTMLRLGSARPELRIVSDQHCTPTYVPHLARAIMFLVGGANGRPAPWGTYHATNTGETTWHAFAAEIFRQAEMTVKLHPITTAEYGAPAARPSYSVLDTSAYRQLGGPADARLESSAGRVFCGMERVAGAIAGRKSNLEPLVASMPEILLLCEYATMNGGERSMLATLDGVRAAGFTPIVMAPSNGPLADALMAAGIELLPFEFSCGRRGPPASGSAARRIVGGPVSASAGAIARQQPGHGTIVGTGGGAHAAAQLEPSARHRPSQRPGRGRCQLPRAAAGRFARHTRVSRGRRTGGGKKRTWFTTASILRSSALDRQPVTCIGSLGCPLRVN